MRHVYDKKRVRDAVLSLSPGTVFTANDIVDLIGNKSPPAQSVGWYLRMMDDLVARVPTHIHKSRPWRRI